MVSFNLLHIKWYFLLNTTRRLFHFVVGIKLRKVEKKEQKENSSGGLTDVASILARRVAIELSGTDTDSDSDDDSEGWADHNETSA